MARPLPYLGSPLAVPAELLRLSGGALRDHDVDEGGVAVVHRFFEGALQILWVLDEEALAAEACPSEGWGPPSCGRSGCRRSASWVSC
jgi:hypothetical protein